jgi:hypothetical protein
MVGKADKQSEGSKFLALPLDQRDSTKNISPLLFQKSRRKKLYSAQSPPKQLLARKNY